MNISNIYEKININTIIKEISQYNGKKINIMEVCGTHTSVIYKNKIDDLLPDSINLISGPGCPVCVTPEEYIDKAIYLSHMKDTIILTFGDLLKVNGSKSNLKYEKSIGNDIRIICSTLDVLHICKSNPNKEIILLAVGFETTISTYALLLEEITRNNIKNVSLLMSLKTIPYTLDNIFMDKRINVQGIIAPGHVATVIGKEPFTKMSSKFCIPSVISGFNGEDILISIYTLINMIESLNYTCINLYKYAVRNDGNDKAKQLIEKFFITSDANFRGIGLYKKSGLTLIDDYSYLDAQKKFNINVTPQKKLFKCDCAEIILGIKKPTDCNNFGKSCTLETPLGPCMVSMEGTCSNYFRYKYV